MNCPTRGKCPCYEHERKTVAVTDPLAEPELLREIEALRTARAGYDDGEGHSKPAEPMGQAEATLLLTLAIVRNGVRRE